MLLLAPPILLAAAAARGSAQNAPVSPAAPVVVANPPWANIPSSQNLTVGVNVSGGSGNPTPAGVVTVMSNNPPPQVYDTFQHPDGTLINGLATQSGNSVWVIQGTGIGEVVGSHLLNVAPSGESGDLYASLAYTSTINGTPQAITTIGGTIRMCPSAAGTYDPSYTSVGMIASHELSFANFIEIGFGPTSWWLHKNVNGVQTTLRSGSENLPVDCATEYTVQIVINQAAGTLQVIPPNGIPSDVITDPDITQIDALYGTWEPENNAPNKYIGEWGSVWLGGGYVSQSTPINGGNASIQIPGSSLAAGADTLMVNYAPDTSSSSLYAGGRGFSDVTVQNPLFGSVAPAVIVQPSAASANLAQGSTVFVEVTGPDEPPAPSGTVMLMASSAATPSFPVIYDTFQYPDGTELSQQVAQSGNSQWSWSGGAKPTVTGMRLNPLANAVDGYYVSLANTSVPGGTPAPVTALGASFQLCPSPGSSSYDPAQGSMAILAQHDTSLTNHIDLSFAPKSWALSKTVNGGASTTLAQGAEDLVADCNTTYAAEMLLDPAAGTVQVIPPNGIPSPVITDPDVTNVHPLYGTWESASGTTCSNCAFASVGSVWMGGGYLAQAQALSGGIATFILPRGSVPLGADKLTASYLPDAQSAAAYFGATGSGSITVSPSFTLSASPSSLPVAPGGSGSGTISITGSDGFLGQSVLTASGLPSGVTASFAAGSTAGTQLVTFAAAASAPITTSPAVVTILGTSGNLSSKTQIALDITSQPAFTLPASPASLSIAPRASANSTVSVTGTGGFAGPVSLTASGLPSGVTVSFAAGSSARSQVVTFTVAALAPATTAAAVVTIRGVSGSLTASTQIAISITAPPGFAGAGVGSNSISISAGATTGNTVTVSIVGTNGFAGIVKLNCAVASNLANLVDSPQCSLNPAALTVSGNAAQNSMLTVTTTASSSAKNRKPEWLPAGGTVLALLALLIVPRSRRRWPLLLVLVVFGGSIGGIGCGGGASSSQSKSGGNSGTTPGAYIVTVSGASGSLSATVATINLTIQ